MEPGTLPLDTLLLLRVLKLAAAMALGAGTVGAFLPRDLEDRRRAAYFVAGPGLGASWALGFILAWARGHSPLSAWILGALALSLVSINVVLWATGREGRRTAGAAAVALAALVATLVLMVWQPGAG